MAFLSVASNFSNSNSLRAANSAHSSIVHGRDGRRENDAMECLIPEQTDETLTIESTWGAKKDTRLNPIQPTTATTYPNPNPFNPHP